MPGPPRGPGVQPPFAAPPSEGRTARFWWGFGLGVIAIFVCGGLGLAAIVGVFATGNAALNEQAHSAVEDYLQAVGAGEYPQAYGMLCQELRDRQSLRQFTTQVTNEPRVGEYELRQTQFRDEDQAFLVPAHVRFTDGGQEDVTYRLLQDRHTGEMMFCGMTG